MEVTRAEFELRKDFVEKALMEVGATPTDLGGSHTSTNYFDDTSETTISNRTVLTYNKGYYRVDEFLLSPDKPFIVIECADTEEQARNNVMEDADPFPYDLSDSDIRKEIKELLKC